MHVSILSSRSMMAEVPMCWIDHQVYKILPFPQKIYYLYKQKFQGSVRYTIQCMFFNGLVSKWLTCSGLRPIRMDRTLEKKLARSGLRGGSLWRKLYSFIRSFSSSPSRSLIWPTSDVSSSHEMLGYLEGKKSYSSNLYQQVLLFVNVYKCVVTEYWTSPFWRGASLQ